MIKPTIIQADGELAVRQAPGGVYYIGNAEGLNVCVDASDQMGVPVAFSTIQEAQALIDIRTKAKANVPN